MSRLLLLLCCLSWAWGASQAMSTHHAARLANTAYLNHRQALIEQLTAPVLDERLRAMHMLARLQDAAAVEHILPFIDEIGRSPEEIIAAMRALAHLGAQVAIPACSAMRRHPDAAVRKAAYSALAQLEALSAPHYFDLSGETQAGLRATGVIGLGLSDADRQEAAVVLRAALHDRDAHIRRMAAIALGDLMDRASAPDLMEALTDSNPGVRRRAAESLVRLDYKQAIPNLLIAMEANFAGAHLNAALMALSGQDFGFNPASTAASRRIAIDEAFRWYTANAGEMR